MTNFTRSLGKESGVQLNPLADGSALADVGQGDQVVATFGRFSRGRIDKPFLVDQSNYKRLLGAGKPVRSDALNETYVQISEALNNGAKGVLVHRLVPAADAKVSWVVATLTDGVTLNYQTTTPVTAVNSLYDGQQITTGSDDLPYGENELSGYLVAIKLIECWNEGVVISIHAPQVLDDNGDEVPTSIITVEILTENLTPVYSFTGSTSSDDVDDYGQSIYLPDVVARTTDLVEVMVGVDGSGVLPAASFYGYNESGEIEPAYTTNESSGEIEPVYLFVEGGSRYLADDYQRAYDAVLASTQEFGSIASAGTVSTVAIQKMAQLSNKRNVPFILDIPGDMPLSAAILFTKQFAFNSMTNAHLIHPYWMPVKSSCPAGINPHGYFGASMLQAAKRCARNAIVNSYGFAAKNYPVAGYDFPISRLRLVQDKSIGKPELSKLAACGINPVMYESYTDGSRVVFADSLTQSLGNSLKKLVSVAEMSTAIDDLVVKFVKRALQKPMSVTVSMSKDYITDLLERAHKSGWLVPSDDPAMNGKPFALIVEPDANQPYDKVQVRYSVRYDGTNRQTEVTHTLVR